MAVGVESIRLYTSPALAALDWAGCGEEDTGPQYLENCSKKQEQLALYLIAVEAIYIA